MKKIVLNIDDPVLNEIRTCLGLRIMGGSAGGIQDEALAKIVKAIDNEEKEVTLQFKGDRK